MVAAKVERLSLAFGVEGGGFVHAHSADEIFGYGFRLFHGHAPFLVIEKLHPYSRFAGLSTISDPAFAGRRDKRFNHFCSP